MSEYEWSDLPDEELFAALNDDSVVLRQQHLGELQYLRGLVTELQNEKLHSFTRMNATVSSLKNEYECKLNELVQKLEGLEHELKIAVQL